MKSTGESAVGMMRAFPSTRLDDTEPVWHEHKTQPLLQDVEKVSRFKEMEMV